MKRLMLLMQTVLRECGARCDISTDRDWKTVTRRVENEGLEFLTITLPTFCSDLERALDRGEALTSDWTGWSKSGRLPVFMGSFLELIFDRISGRLVTDLVWDEIQSHMNQTLLSDPDLPMNTFYRNSIANAHKQTVDAIVALRQVTRLFSKIEIESSQKRIDLAFNNFRNCEKELEAHCVDPTQEFDLDRIGRLLYGTTFNNIRKELFEGHPLPKHGPGSTADKLIGNKKFEQTEWPVRLDAMFPAGEYLLPSWRYK